MEKLKGKFIVGIVLAVLIVAGSTYSWWQKRNIINSTEILQQNEQAEEFQSAQNKVAVVYISGAVNKPGMYSIDNGTRVLDAINIAGGFTQDADLNKVNVAKQIKDGMHIAVPLIKDKQVANHTSRTGASSNANSSLAPSNTQIKVADKININTADKSELEQLPGIGPVIADKIIEFRQTNGSFKTLRELEKVSGIGPSKYKQIASHVTL